MYKLVISDDEGKTTVVPLIRDEITIGRKEGNTIRLTDRNVSRFHARVIRRDDESFIIEDLGSLCGTNVNNSVLRSEKHLIASGDKISIGDYSLSIRSDVGAEVPMGKQMEPGDQAGIGRVTPHARLALLTPPHPGLQIDLTAELYVIGRSEESNCRLEHPSISRAHARIDYDAGQWTISDLDSINGILINGLKKDDYVLKAGDIIRLGSVEIRYVAPGEPYDFIPPESAGEEQISREPSDRKKNRRMLPVLVGVGSFAAAAIAAGVFLFVHSQPRENPKDELKDTDDTFESLMEEGKDKMQGEEWSEAARLFALAQQKDPSRHVAREMKDLAIREADAQQAFNSGLGAQENHSWEEAMSYFSKISPSSHYYDPEQIKLISDKLCDELLEKATFIQKTGSVEDLHAALAEILQIPNAPKRCRGTKMELLRRIEKRTVAGLDAGQVNNAYQRIQRRSSRSVNRLLRKQKSDAPPSRNVANPYDHIDNPYE